MSVFNYQSFQDRMDPKLLKLVKQVKYNATGFYIGVLITIISYLNLEIGGVSLNLFFKFGYLEQLK